MYTSYYDDIKRKDVSMANPHGSIDAIDGKKAHKPNWDMFYGNITANNPKKASQIQCIWTHQPSATQT